MVNKNQQKQVETPSSDLDFPQKIRPGHRGHSFPAPNLPKASSHPAFARRHGWWKRTFTNGYWHVITMCFLLLLVKMFVLFHPLCLYMLLLLHLFHHFSPLDWSRIWDLIPSLAWYSEMHAGRKLAEKKMTVFNRQSHGFTTTPWAYIPFSPHICW